MIRFLNNLSLKVALVVVFAFASFDTYSQCVGMPGVVSLGSNKSPNKLCSSVNADLFYNIGFDAPLPPGTYNVLFFWGDGTVTDILPITADGIALNYNVSLNHTYPVNSDCEYLTQIVIFQNGFICFSTYQTQYIQSYRTEAFNQGLVQLINPLSGTDIFDVCEGSDISAVFDDLTNFNCNANYQPNYPTGAAPIQAPNKGRRWQQIVYNTKVNAGTRIPNVAVNGVPVTGAGGVDILIIIRIPEEYFF